MYVLFINTYVNFLLFLKNLRCGILGTLPKNVLCANKVSWKVDAFPFIPVNTVECVLSLEMDSVSGWDCQHGDGAGGAGKASAAAADWRSSAGREGEHATGKCGCTAAAFLLLCTMTHGARCWSLLSLHRFLVATLQVALHQVTK